MPKLKILQVFRPEIVVRRISTNFASAPRYWADGNPWSTRFTTAMSFLFPEGERTFVRSVKYFQNRLQAPWLKEAVASFVGQELLHGNTHEALNSWIASQHADTPALIEETNAFTRRFADVLMTHRPIDALAFTVALEHLTAILASSLLSHPELVEILHPLLQPLLVWHAIEEIEHKDVAFDVYQAVEGGYLRRVLWLAFAPVILGLRTSQIQIKLLRQDGELMNWQAALHTARDLFGPSGLITATIPSYLRAFAPSFHPSNIDDNELLERWLSILHSMTEVTSVTKVKRKMAG